MCFTWGVVTRKNLEIKKYRRIGKEVEKNNTPEQNKDDGKKMQPRVGGEDATDDENIIEECRSHMICVVGPGRDMMKTGRQTKKKGERKR